jgi:LysR family transcriptional regulator, cell division regulator
MDAADLRVFEVVARLGAMNRAAAELNTVQSNVTARVRHLEELLGTTLFDRHSGGVALTRAGQRLLPYASRVSQLLQEAGRAVEDDGTPKGPLSLGALESTVKLQLSPILIRYAARYREVDLILRTANSADLTVDVLEYRLEGAFVCGPVAHADLEEEIVFHEPLVLVIPAGIKDFDQVIKKGDIRIIVHHRGCSYGQRLEAYFARHGVVGLCRIEFGTIDAVLECIAAGVGMTLLPKNLVTQAWRDRGITFRELPGPDAVLHTVFIRRRDAYVSSALDAFMQFARIGPSRLQAPE